MRQPLCAVYAEILVFILFICGCVKGTQLFVDDQCIDDRTGDVEHRTGHID